MPARPDDGARSRSSSTSSPRRHRRHRPHERTGLMSPQARLRPRGRPLHPAHLVLARRGIPARAAPGREPGAVRRPSPSTPLADPVGGHPPRPADQPLGDVAPLPVAAACRACSSPSPSTTSRCRFPPCAGPTSASSSSSRSSSWPPRPGVDDVVLIAALALHRRMTDAELRHALGDRVFDAFAPHGLLRQHDAEDPDKLDPSRAHRPGRGRRDQQAGRHLGPPRLRQHQPRGHGRRPQVGGHRPGQLQEPAPPPQRPHHDSRAGRSWTSTAPSCTPRTGAWAGSSPTSGVKVFQIETTLNTDTFPEQFRFLQRREWEWSARGPGRLRGHVEGARRAPPTELARSIFHSIRSPHKMTRGPGRRGRGRPRPHHRERLRASSCSRSRARPTSSPWGCPTSAPTTSTRS